MYRVWIAIGGIAGLLAVAMAAYASHGLDTLPPGRLHAVLSGVQMQGWHALALLACGVWAERRGGLAHWAGAAFTLGLLLFCAATYSSGLAGVSLGVVAPTGGFLLMGGWLLLTVSALRPAR